MSINNVLRNICRSSYKDVMLNKSKGNKWENHICELLLIDFKNTTLEELFRIEYPEAVLKNSKDYKNLFESFKKNVKKNKHIFCNHKGLSFIYQPFGTQNPPDFLILHDTKIEYLEAKSAKRQFQFNSVLPVSHQIYAFINLDGTSIMRGKDIVDEDCEFEKDSDFINLTINKLNDDFEQLLLYIRSQRGNFKSLVKIFKDVTSKLTKTLNKYLVIVDNPLNINYYQRDMWVYKKSPIKLDKNKNISDKLLKEIGDM